MIKMAKKAVTYWKLHGTRLLLKRVIQKLIARPGDGAAQKRIGGKDSIPPSGLSRDILDKRYTQARPMITRHRTGNGFNRINIVTDSVCSGSLFGGVGTALLFGAFLANALNAQCRIITRTERPDERMVFAFLRLCNIVLKQELQFKFEPCDDGGSGVEFAEDELFVTTSWWTTASTLSGVDESHVIYLLQEDERMFYPAGDDWVRAHKVMRNENIQIVVNTELLYDHMVSNGFGNIARTGLWFEPSFPNWIYRRSKSREDRRRRRFFFYARPHNPRNLFYLGLEVIDRALMKGVINSAEWDIFFVGSNVPDITLFGDVRPVVCDKIPWNDYAHILSTIDVGLSLMSTPHPSYPPLDLAASGAVAVTNRFGLKQDLSKYSHNILCSDLSAEDIVSTIDTAIKMAADTALRTHNYCYSGLGRSWEQSFSEVVGKIVGGLHDRH